MLLISQIKPIPLPLPQTLSTLCMRRNQLRLAFYQNNIQKVQDQHSKSKKLVLDPMSPKKKTGLFDQNNVAMTGHNFIGQKRGCKGRSKLNSKLLNIVLTHSTQMQVFILVHWQVFDARAIKDEQFPLQLMPDSNENNNNNKKFWVHQSQK